MGEAFPHIIRNRSVFARNWAKRRLHVDLVYYMFSLSPSSQYSKRIAVETAGKSNVPDSLRGNLLAEDGSVCPRAVSPDHSAVTVAITRR